jgi:hypothetical protein
LNTTPSGAVPEVGAAVKVAEVGGGVGGGGELVTVIVAVLYVVPLMLVSVAL